jgi:hypothetical protein
VLRAHHDSHLMALQGTVKHSAEGREWSVILTTMAEQNPCLLHHSTSTGPSSSVPITDPGDLVDSIHPKRPELSNGSSGFVFVKNSAGMNSFATGSGEPVKIATLAATAL